MDIQSLTFPIAAPPAPGEILEIAPGVLWFRLKLPFQLNHVNIYLIEDDNGWLVLDTGLGTDECRAGWDGILNGPLKGQRLSAMLVTHFHPDHVGLAGWLAQSFGLKLAMPRTEYLYHLMAAHGRGDMYDGMHREFYRANGLTEETTNIVLGRGHNYLRLTTGVPESYDRIQHGDVRRVGGRDFRILTGGGHALEQATLHQESDRLFFAADQVIARISPNVSVHPVEPAEDPLGTYLIDLAALRATVPNDVLVLPGHGLPFLGLHTRIDELIEHHALRCARIADGCRERPLSAADLVPTLFDRALDAHQTGFAFGEVLAHLNYMTGRRELFRETGNDGVHRFQVA
ncbi:MAG: MBL fold metallo-hydrolase [Acetobacteraceae bacterium]|nr:MBL fold metallo-hydrolase [Acetobacteraceae bacterium]